MADLTAGKKFDRVSMTWLEPEEYDRRRAHWEEIAFQKRPTQGQLCAPMVLSDTMDAVESMTNGKHYDSKSQLRKEYRQAGVVEVGNEGTALRQKRENTRKEQEAIRSKGIRASVERGLSRAGFGAV